MRSAHGPRIVKALSLCTDSVISVSDFNFSTNPGFKLSIASNIASSQGFVSAYICKAEAINLVSCIQQLMGVIDGFIGVYGNEYLGYCFVKNVDLLGVVCSAETLNEGIVIFPNNLCGALLIDHYSGNSTGAFSVVAQGAEVEGCAKGCFDASALSPRRESL
jgi:hypothetical protein